MEKQSYTQAELFDKINWIETNQDECQLYRIRKKDSIEKTVELIKNHISEYYIYDEDIDVNEWNVIYNNIFITIDFERSSFYLQYIESEINKSDIDIITDAFAFLHLIYIDRKEEEEKTKIYIEKQKQKQSYTDEETRGKEIEKRKNNAFVKKQNQKMGWKAYVETFYTRR